MAWAIITICTCKCSEMDPHQLPKMSTFYSRCKKCDIEKTFGGTTPLGNPKVNRGQSPYAFSNYFEVFSQVHSHFTRRVNDYRVDFARTNSRRFSMKITGPNIWNDLPADIRRASNSYSFKRLLCAYLTNSYSLV